MHQPPSEGAACVQTAALKELVSSASAQGGDWRSRITREAVEATLAPLPPVDRPERTGEENRGVRVYNLSGDHLAATVLDDMGAEIPGHGLEARPFDLGQGWDERCGFMTSPMTSIRITCAGGVTTDYFVNGDSTQAILVLPPAVEEGLPPEPVRPAVAAAMGLKLLMFGGLRSKYDTRQMVMLLPHPSADQSFGAIRRAHVSAGASAV